MRQKIERALDGAELSPEYVRDEPQSQKSPETSESSFPIVDPFFAEVVGQIELRCMQAGDRAIVLSSHGQSSLEANALDTLRSLKISGAIIAPLGAASDAHRIEQLSGEVPVVFLDSRTSDRIPFAGTDNDRSISLIVDYLCRSGEPPCFLEMPWITRTPRSGRAPSVVTMKRLGFEPATLPLDEDTGWKFEEIGTAATRRILAEGGFPTRTSCARTTAWRLACWRRRIRTGCASGSSRAANCASPAMTTIRFRGSPVPPSQWRRTMRPLRPGASRCCSSMIEGGTSAGVQA